MRELPFGARISDSFVEMLTRETVKAKAECPEAAPCLWAEEEQRYETLRGAEPHPKRIDLEEGPEIPPVNRLAPPNPAVMLIRERVWVLYFDKGKYAPEATFSINGLELHIPLQVQSQLIGATLDVVRGKIVATYEPA